LLYIIYIYKKKKLHNWSVLFLVLQFGIIDIYIFILKKKNKKKKKKKKKNYIYILYLNLLLKMFFIKKCYYYNWNYIFI